MKCFECPAQREITDPATNPLCNAGVRPWMLKCQKIGCRYSAEQVTRWLKKKAPKSNADVLLERWAKDTECFAHETLELFWNVCLERYEFPDGSYGLSETDGLRAYIAYLNSAAEGARHEG